MDSYKIITIVGSPACGKSFLAKKLASYYNAIIIEELPLELPEKIKQNLSTQTNLFENQIWFRNLHLQNYKNAINNKNLGKNVILDAPFYQNQLYNDLMIKDEFEKQILDKMGQHDLETYNHTDITIYIENNVESIIKFLENRKGNWSWKNDNWRKFIKDIIPYQINFMKKIENQIPNLIKIKREEWDFEKEEHLKKLIKIINKKLNSLE